MVEFMFKLARRFVSERGVEIMRVVTLNPSTESVRKFKGTGPLPKPKAFLLQGAHHPFRVRISPSEIGLHQKAGFSHDPEDSLSVDRKMVDKLKVSPDPSVPPEGVFGLKGQDAF